MRRFLMTLEAGPAKHFEHGLILGLHDGPKALKAIARRQHRQPFQQERSDAFPLKLVRDGYGDLRRCLVPGRVSACGNDPFAALC